MASPLVGMTGVNSLLFAAYGASKRLISPFPDLPLSQIAAAGAMAGAVNSVLASPGMQSFRPLNLFSSPFYLGNFGISHDATAVPFYRSPSSWSGAEARKITYYVVIFTLVARDLHDHPTISFDDLTLLPVSRPSTPPFAAHGPGTGGLRPFMLSFLLSFECSMVDQPFFLSRL